MVDRLLKKLLREIPTRKGAKAVFSRVLSLAIKAGHSEAAAREMMETVATGPNKIRARHAFILGLYDDNENVTGMRGNANAVARFLVEIGFSPTREAADKAVDYARKNRPGRGRKK
jgi:hypothetical protein